MTEKEWKARLKANHICVNCKKTDAYTMAGRSYCAECAEKMAEKKRELRHDEAYRLKSLQDAAEWRKRMAEEHRCTRYGKAHSPTWKKKLCAECFVYSKRKCEERRRSKGVRTWDMRNEEGTCFICGKPAIHGKRMCQDCYEQRLPGMMENLRKAWENNTWRTAKA